MATESNRLSAVTERHLKNNPELSGMYGLNGSDKNQFDIARQQIKTVLANVQKQIDPTLSIIVRDNDLYWYLEGGLNFAIFGGVKRSYGHFWLDDDGTVYAGGYAFPKDGQGQKVGSSQGVDPELVEAYIIDHLEKAVGL